MQKLQKTLRVLFGFAFGLSIGFPCGILCIIFGASAGIVPLLVFGIVLTASGFYAMPILWVQYGERRQDKNLLYMITEERIDTVAQLSAQTGLKDEIVRQKVKKLIVSRYLTGYLFENDTLRPNIDPATIPAPVKKCPSCGADMVRVGNVYKCEYCGTVTE